MVFLILTLLLSIGTQAFELGVECRPISRCGDVFEKVANINKNSWSSYDDFEKSVKKISLSFDIQYFSIEKRSDELLFIRVEKKLIVRNIIYEAEGVDETLISKRLPIKAGIPFPSLSVTDVEKNIEIWMKENGYVDPSVEILRIIKNNKYNVFIKIKYEDILNVDSIKLLCDAKKYCAKLYGNIFKQYENKRLNSTEIKSFASRIKREAIDDGFPEAKLTYTTQVDGSNVNLSFNLKLGTRVHFAFDGELVLSEASFKDFIKKESSGYGFKKMDETIRSIMVKKYKEFGYFSTAVNVRESRFLSIDDIPAVTFFISVKKGFRYNVSGISFLGNSSISNQEIRSLFYEKSTVLAQRDIFDEPYVLSFRDILREKYLRSGFVYVDIAKPEIQFNKVDKTVKVIFAIKERQRSLLQTIKLDGLDQQLEKEAKLVMDNREGKPLNIIGLESDILKVVGHIRDRGYLFANLKDTGDVVKYKSNSTESEISLSFFTGKKAFLEEIVLTGNVETKKEVLLREVEARKGQLVTPRLLKKTKDSLNSLGLFSQVSVTPVILSGPFMSEYKIRLVIEVREREFGRIEIAPGFRSDLGAKFSLSFLQNNLWGLNHSFQAKLLLNRRFSFSGIDDRRSKGGHKMEGLLKLGYSWPYLFSGVSFDTSLSFQRRRFFSFDADIARLSPQFAKKWNDVFSSTFKYQFEQIRQYDAINDDDNANFRIGGITPSVTLDFRDNPISPRSGSFFGLSWEYTAPILGSQDDDDIEINFSKIISRNKFYIPIAKKKFVFAINLALGYQKNYARDLQRDRNGAAVPLSITDDTSRTRGYIPSIKVFRLDGFDLIRGFSDNEINRLDSGIDITLTRVQGEAYFANFKFEPRYYIDDNFVFGIFFDAGRIFVNSFKPLSLRSAVGVTMKLLTPVGSLDFDYGIKTNPISLPQGGKEGFGRFHLNVGTF